MSERPTAENGLRPMVERVLRENGLTDQPDKFDSSIHSWRCEHPDIYGPCSCFAELVDDLTRVPVAEGCGMSPHAEKYAPVKAVVRVLAEHENLWGDDYTTCRCGAETVNLGGLRTHVAAEIVRVVAAEIVRPIPPGSAAP